MLLWCLDVDFYCQCGCGIEIKVGKKYSHGHNMRTEETKKKVSIRTKGEKNPMFGKQHLEEAKRRISIANSGENHGMFGTHRSEEFKAKISLVHKGESKTEEHKEKLSLANKGKHHSEETKAKISIANSGENCSEETRRKRSFIQTGKHHNEETKLKISLGNKGGKNGLWQGGISSIPYGPGDTEELKEQIRIRDNYSCQTCNKVWVEGEEKFATHHIDYNKNNHVFWNRVTMCRKCHGKTTINRQYWTELLYKRNFENCIKRVALT